MPKCPRCQKEVYFGKGFLSLPSRPHPGGHAGLYILWAPRLLAPILRSPSLQTPGISQSCSALRCGSPGCPGWVSLQIHPQGDAWLQTVGCAGFFHSSMEAQPHFLPSTARSPEPVWSPKAQLVNSLL